SQALVEIGPYQTQEGGCDPVFALPQLDDAASGQHRQFLLQVLGGDLAEVAAEVARFGGALAAQALDDQAAQRDEIALALRIWRFGGPRQMGHGAPALTQAPRNTREAQPSLLVSSEIADRHRVEELIQRHR